MTTKTPEVMGYLAGIVDGLGAIRIRIDPGRAPAAELTIRFSNTETGAFLARETGASVREYTGSLGHRMVVSFTGLRAMIVLGNLLPLLIEKRAEAVEALATPRAAAWYVTPEGRRFRDGEIIAEMAAHGFTWPVSGV